MNRNTFLDCANRLLSSSSWFITIHEKPDGDAVGSACALLEMAKQLRKRAAFGGSDPLPGLYGFLPSADAYQLLPSIPESFSKEGCAVVVLDTSNPERTLPGLLAKKGKALCINIDHHVDNTHFGDLNLVLPGASATGEILADVFNAVGWPLSFSVAIGLYTAILTDTGKFSYSCTGPHTHEIAATLLREGVKPEEIERQVFNNFTLAKFQLWGRAMSHAIPLVDGKGIIASISKDDFRETSTSPADTENLASEFLKVGTVVLAILCIEAEEEVRISLRSKGPFARDIASRFGGGGHAQAAGCRIKAPLPQAVEMLIQTTEEYDALRASCSR